MRACGKGKGYNLVRAANTVASLVYSIYDRYVETDILFVLAIECDGASLPSFADAESYTSHTGMFPYALTVSYYCPSGLRFEDGNMDIVVTCTGVGFWDWNHIATSCGRELIM